MQHIHFLHEKYSNPKPDFPTVIKTSISLIPKHQRNICPNSKRNTNQSRITF